MNAQRKLWAAAAGAATLAVAGCWGGDDDDPLLDFVPPITVTTEVPDSAGIGTASFFSFLMSLSGSDESSEPLTIKDSFAVPADETAEPTPFV